MMKFKRTAFDGDLLVKSRQDLLTKIYHRTGRRIQFLIFRHNNVQYTVNVSRINAHDSIITVWGLIRNKKNNVITDGFIHIRKQEFANSIFLTE